MKAKKLLTPFLAAALCLGISTASHAVAIPTATYLQSDADITAPTGPDDYTWEYGLLPGYTFENFQIVKEPTDLVAKIVPHNPPTVSYHYALAPIDAKLVSSISSDKAFNFDDPYFLGEFQLSDVQIEVTGFSANGNIVAQYIGSGGADGWWHNDMAELKGINKVTFRSLEGQGYMIDAPVPEPTSMLLTLAGLAGLATRKRKKAEVEV